MSQLQARMKPVVQVIPEAMNALLALAAAAESTGIAPVTLKLVELRASQINGCSVCVDMHARQLARAGEASERIYTVAAWHDAPYFTAAERAALALTEALTRCDVPDDVWEEAARHFDERQLAALVLDIAGINAWNRLNIATRTPSGAWVAAY